MKRLNNPCILETCIQPTCNKRLTLAFIVSCFNSCDDLLCCLASLKIQWKSAYFKIVLHVSDNSNKSAEITKIKSLCQQLGVVYHKTSGGCYNAAEQVVKEIEADWFCFPSSDSYYVPGFSAIMLETAARTHADVVYCDCVYDPRLHGRGIYSILSVFPEMRWIDKTCFIVRKDCFHGFPAQKDDWRDGALIENLVKKGRTLVKAKGILVVHN